MLLFSALLEVNETLTKDDFIQLVVKWNQDSPYEENVIHGIVWSGEHTIRYGTDPLWLSIEEYKDIIAVRYEKTDSNGVVWDTDFVVNFHDRKISIRLERSYLEEVLMTDHAVIVPYFITMLIQAGYLKDDGIFPISQKPIMLTQENIGMAEKCHLPIVSVSKTETGEYPVDISALASRLKGAAHVLVQDDETTASGGIIDVYFPHKAYQNKRYTYREYDGADSALAEKIIQSVFQYGNAQSIDSMYTWQGVSKALLQEQLNETDELVKIADEDIEGLKQRIQQLIRENETLQYENQGLRTKLNASNSMPILFMGQEDEFYAGEIKDIILSVLTNALPNIKKNTRRQHVVEDIIHSNDYQQLSKSRAADLKKLLNDYNGMTKKLRQELEQMGFVIKEDGKHYKFVYYGDPRYSETFAKTPSEYRGSKNNTSEIIKKLF